MRHQLPATLAAALLLAAPAAAQQPEINRDPATAQAVGETHALRTITEACTRLEGVFTDEPEPPYAVRVVPSAPGCQPRARFDQAATPVPDGGWVLNDRITVPSAACEGQSAVVEVWRLPGEAATPELDAQGRARIYLDEGRDASQAGRLAAVTTFAATLEVEGTPCP